MNVFVAKHMKKHESERFDPVKLHQSVTAACLAVRALEGEAHLVAQRVCEKVIDWLSDKTEITSSDIRRIASEGLKTYHPEAAYVYEHYKVMV